MMKTEIFSRSSLVMMMTGMTDDDCGDDDENVPGAAYSGCDQVVTVLLLIMAVGSNGFIYSGEQSCMMDVSNNFAGTLMGIINALGKTVILNILDVK